MQKALLNALLTPNEVLKDLQEKGEYTKLLVMQEEFKTLPFGAVWEEYLKRQKVLGINWIEEVEKYEKEVLVNRV